MQFPEPIADIAPERFESWLTRQGWVKSDKKEMNGTRPHWEKDCWAVSVFDSTLPDRSPMNRDVIKALAWIHDCEQWEVAAAIKIEPIVISPSGQPEAHGTIELYDQVERLDVGDGAFVELTDHNPATIKADSDGLDLLIGLAISAKYGWGNAGESIGRGGGSFALTVEKI